MNILKISRILTIIAAFALFAMLALSVASAYPYSNYYGPSDDISFRQTTSKVTENSKTIQSPDFYEQTTNRVSEQTNTQQTANNDNDYYAYNNNRYYNQPSYQGYIQPGPSPSYISGYNDYYANHFQDYEFPTYNYNYNNRGYYLTYNRPTPIYLSGDNPQLVGYEHYSTPYVYAPVSNGQYYDWHAQYYAGY